MTDRPDPSIDVAGPAAPPRRNGELVFQAPWEGRAFGLAVALRDRGVFRWEVFRDRLIAAIAAADRTPTGTAKPGYYDSWLSALRSVLAESGLVTPGQIEERIRQFEAGDRDIVNPGGART